MRVFVDLTYDMGKLAGAHRIELTGVETVADVIDLARARIGPAFEAHARLAAVAVNGVLTNYRRGRRTALQDGDVVAFVKASAGG